MIENDFKEFYLDVEGILRYYYLYVPSTSSDRKGMPLMILLHGAGGNPRTIRNISSMNKIADEYGFIVAYPQGTGPKDKKLTWNAGQCCGFAFENNIDDISFINLLIEELILEWPIDENRVYIAGVSNGGMLTHRIACELSSKIVAAAAVAASLPKNPTTPKRPVPFIMFHGTADPYVPYNGGKSKITILEEPVFHASVDETLSFWVKHNGCYTKPEIEENNIVKKAIYSSREKNCKVILYTIDGGGHTWPGPNLKKLAPNDPMRYVHASQLIWDFFTKLKD